jgi:hypothetical protein
MEKIVKTSINEDYTESFVINSKTKRLLPKRDNSYSYWRGNKKGTIDTEIEIFSFSNHRKYAKELYDALKAAGLENKYSSIKVQVKNIY